MDDLYDDVDDAKLAPTASFSGDRPKSLTDRVQELEQLVTELQAENNSLRRNIGTLYRTAIAELARKDRKIQELQQLSSGSGP
mgnify:CR=1 FL=1